MRKEWLKMLGEPVPGTLKTPAELAVFEAGQAGEKVNFLPDPALGEGYVLDEMPEGGFRIRGGSQGLLYGVYALIRARAAGEPLPAGLQRPYYPLRMLDCWDNMDGSIERGYSGRSLWFEDDGFSYDPARIRQLGRLLASVGINVLCPNNVNVLEPAQELIGAFLPELSAFADLLRPFGIRLMVSVDFAMPLREGLETADPLDPRVAEWWAEKAGAVYAAVPDLAGFLVKADSEHRPGPSAYGRTHAQGANMLARALKPYGGRVVWRAFVYNCMQDWRDTATDRPCAAYDLYRPQDGRFDDGVILQVKNGPYDFQVREPVSPLFYAMPRTALALEFQLAQEYTGHQVDIYAMPPMWREILDDLGKQRVQAIAAVSNLGRDDCVTGHPFAALNLFAYGLFAWDPDLDPGQAIRQWIRLTYHLPAEQERLLGCLLADSRQVYEQYTAPLGLCWMVRPETHYGPSPYGYEFSVWGTYNRADRDAVGIDRTDSGTGYTRQYPPHMAAVYEDPAQCPENMILFFHRLPYGYVMRDGRTLIQRIYDDHFAGCEAAEKMREILEGLALPPEDRKIVLARMEMQLRNAREWRDVINTFFRRFSGMPDALGRKIYE